MQIILLSDTKCLWLPQYVNTFLVWHKKFEPAQNILRPVKGQGMSDLHDEIYTFIRTKWKLSCYKDPDSQWLLDP